MLHINTTIDNNKVRSIKYIDVEEGKSTAIDNEMKTELIAKVTLDKRLTAKDMRVYVYLLNFKDEYLTQEQIADILDMSRSNINKSIEKLTALNYIEKISSPNWKEVTKYVIVPYHRAGITDSSPNEIIRLLNVVNKEKDIRRLNYVSIEQEIEYRDTLEQLHARERALREVYIDEKVRKNLDEKYIKEIDSEIEECNQEIIHINEELEDVEYISRLMSKLESEILRRSKLSKDRIKAVLRNQNRKVILFLAYTYQVNIDKFREQYLEDYIMFLSKFTDDLKKDNSKDEPNEDFYILYYESLTTIRHTFDDIMRIAEVTHRDVPERKRNLQSKIVNELNNMRELVIKSKSEIFNDDTKQILYRLIEKCESKAIAKMTFKNTEFILLMVALNKEVQCQKAVCVEFNKYIKIKSAEMYDCIMRYYQYIRKHLKETLQEEE